MFRPTSLARRSALVLASTLALCGTVMAADYPVKPVKWIVPYPPAGTTDVLARIVAQWLTEKMGQPFVVENKPGAGNNIGTEMVVKAEPDGYTMLLVNPANGINATLYKNLNFNVLRDIAPVAGLVRTPNVMVVTANFPARNVAEFIAFCKANPGKVNMASSGSGTSVHLSGELFKSMAGVFMVHFPYRGSGPALIDLMGGSMDLMFDNLPSALPHIKSGKLKALGVTSAKRSDAIPELPTIEEAGGPTLKGFEASSWFALAAPAGTPPEIVSRLQQETAKALATPDMKARMAGMGAIPSGMSTADFTRFIAAETAKWAKVVKAANAKVD